MPEKAFQDYYPDDYARCYGCGRLNEHGLQIKSYWDGDETVCIFQPKPYHTAVPGYVYGGLIASLIDCHSTGTAAAASYRESGRAMGSQPALRFLTASLHVDYVRPTPLGVPLEVRGQIVEVKGRKVVVASTLLANGEVCARGQVLAVQAPERLVAELMQRAQTSTDTGGLSGASVQSADWAMPTLTLLNEDQKQKVHRAALKILAQTGVRVDSEPILKMLTAKLGSSQVDGSRVTFPAELVEWAIQSTPSEVSIFDRLGAPAFTLGNDRMRFGIGVTSLYYQDPITDALTPFSRKNMVEMARLGSRLPLYDVISTVGILQDVPVAQQDLYATLEMAANTIKPLVILTSDDELFGTVLDMLELLSGGLAEKPYIIPYFNPVTPLVLNKGTLDKMETAIQRGLPIIVSNYSLAGMSTPLAPAGMLAVMLAELLGGLVTGQLIRPGAPMILGILPAFMDMKTMVNFYDPQSMLLNLACAEMMAHYQIPHCGTSGSGTGWGPDLLAAETYWMNHLTACLAKGGQAPKGGLAPFVGDTLNSKAFSAVNAVYVHEIIEQALRYSAGFSLAEDELVLDEIIQAGPGGNFLTTKSTRRRYRNAYYSSPIFPRWSMEKWESEGRPAAQSRLREYTLDLLSTLAPPDDYADWIGRGEEFINQFK